MCFVVLVHVVHVFKSWLICITWLCLRPSSWPLLMFMIVAVVVDHRVVSSFCNSAVGE